MRLLTVAQVFLRAKENTHVNWCIDSGIKNFCEVYGYKSHELITIGIVADLTLYDSNIGKFAHRNLVENRIAYPFSEAHNRYLVAAQGVKDAIMQLAKAKQELDLSEKILLNIVDRL